jgi:hypothetical protein
MNLNNDDKYFEPVTKKQRISHYKKDYSSHDSLSLNNIRYDNRDSNSFIVRDSRSRDNDDFFGYV